MTHSNRSRYKINAVFCDGDQWFMTTGSERIYELGRCRPGKYMFVDRGQRSEAQVCERGVLNKGVTLTWPSGIDGAIPPLPGLLRTMGRMLNARTYGSRAAFERHYTPRDDWY